MEEGTTSTKRGSKHLALAYLKIWAGEMRYTINDGDSGTDRVLNITLT